jgi:hypothetical protein
MADPEAADKAFRTNRISAVVMTSGHDRGGVCWCCGRKWPWVLRAPMSALSVLRHEPCAEARGILVKPYPVRQQNFAAYASVSTAGFVATLSWRPGGDRAPWAVMIFVLLAAGDGRCWCCAGIVKSL